MVLNALARLLMHMSKYRSGAGEAKVGAVTSLVVGSRSAAPAAESRPRSGHILQPSYLCSDDWPGSTNGMCTRCKRSNWQS